MFTVTDNSSYTLLVCLSEVRETITISVDPVHFISGNRGHSHRKANHRREQNQTFRPEMDISKENMLAEARLSSLISDDILWWFYDSVQCIWAHWKACPLVNTLVVRLEQMDQPWHMGRERLFGSSQAWSLGTQVLGWGLSYLRSLKPMKPKYPIDSHAIMYFSN